MDKQQQQTTSKERALADYSNDELNAMSLEEKSKIYCKDSLKYSNTHLLDEKTLEIFIRRGNEAWLEEFQRMAVRDKKK